jgi:NAD(P)-dependent dehydrogenase (short-subunit alcohol dehydrogenase family)
VPSETRVAGVAGKIVIVVGAGSIAPGWSNGKACAMSYARAGAAVVCVDQRLEEAEETVRVIKDEGLTAVAMAADATVESDLADVVGRTVAEFGRIDVLHNNVGGGTTSGTPDQVAPQDWDREIALCLTTAYLGIRCVAPVMREQGGGVITSTSSLLAVRPLKRAHVGYTAGKAAVEALTRACAASYGPDNIRVNCLRIGFSETPLLQLGLSRLPADRREAELAKSRAKVPLRGEHTDPFDVGAAAVFLASDAARNITGVVLSVDGGLACAPL